MIKVRFAPSPTGYLHIGNIRTALFNWIFCLKNQGSFVLRFDDTDLERSKDEYVKAIKEDIAWLGIKTSTIAFQSKRFELYYETIKLLKKAGLLYPCYESQEELERKRKILLARKKPPIYDRSALKLTQEKRAAYESEGRRPHWRFLLPNFTKDPFTLEKTDRSWNDLIRGQQTVDLASISDPVLVRADASYLYTLPSIVDDLDLGVTHIIRGDDHVTNTGAQIAIFEALNKKIPQFGHLNLLTTGTGEGLSKRKGTLSIRSLRNRGFEPMAIASLALLIGTSHNVKACTTLKEISQQLDIKDTSKSAAQFNEEDLSNLNRQLVHKLSFEAVQEKLQHLNLNLNDSTLKKFWYIIRENISFVHEAKDWVSVITDTDLKIQARMEDKKFLNQAAQLLPKNNWDINTFSLWTKSIKEATGRNGRSLFLPLRLALTGREYGPELKDLLPLIGYDLAKKRLEIV